MSHSRDCRATGPLYRWGQEAQRGRTCPNGPGAWLPPHLPLPRACRLGAWAGLLQSLCLVVWGQWGWLSLSRKAKLKRSWQVTQAAPDAQLCDIGVSLMGWSSHWAWALRGRDPGGGR